MKNNKGQPDVSGTANFIRIELEFKRKGNKTTKLQDYWVDKWRELGCISGVCYSLEDGYELIKEGLSRYKIDLDLSPLEEAVKKEKKKKGNKIK